MTDRLDSGNAPHVGGFWEFVSILWSSWFGWVGTAFGLIDIAEKVFGNRSNATRYMRRVPFGWIAVACFMLAAFQAWRDERDKAQSAFNGLRRLTDAQRSAMVRILTPPPKGDFTVLVLSRGNKDPEAYRFALDFVEVFRSSGWQVREDHDVYDTEIPGILVAAGDGRLERARQIARAFIGAGIDVTEMFEAEDVPAQQVNVLVGEKLTGPLVR